MERIKGEYLQKILEQVNNQNIEYFENLACEYYVQYNNLLNKQETGEEEPEEKEEPEPVKEEKECTEAKDEEENEELEICD